MSDYDRIAKIIRYINAQREEQPSLDTLAEVAGVSRFHLHRLFTRWAGVTPKDFLQSLTLVHAKRSLLNGNSVLDASLDVGLSSPSRLHDLCVQLVAASPGEIKSGGKGWTIRAGFVDTPFGTCLLAESPRGICKLAFVDSQDRAAAAAAIHEDWPHAEVAWTDHRGLAERIFVSDPQTGTSRLDAGSPLKLFVRGTTWQVRVWQALLEIPAGEVTTYGRLADEVCTRAASRAVGAAIGQNRIGYLIPCHRVIYETGIVGKYRWGTERKQAMLAREAIEKAAEKSAVGKAVVSE